MTFSPRVFLAFSLLLTLPCQSAFAQAVVGRDLLSGKHREVPAGKKGTVVVFLSAKCPCSNSHVPVLKKLAEDFRDFSFVAVHANADEPAMEAKSYFQAVNLPFPVLQDEKGKIADERKALKTPHAFLLSPEGKTLFQGGVTASASAAAADRQYLREALEETRAGKPVSLAHARTLGCLITR